MLAYEEVRAKREAFMALPEEERAAQKAEMKARWDNATEEERVALKEEFGWMRKS